MTDNLDWTGQQSLLAGPMLSATCFGIATSLTPALTVQAITNPPATQHVRLYSLNVVAAVDLSGLYLGDVTIDWVLLDNSLIAKQLGAVGGPVITEPIIWPQGLDLDYGNGVYFQASSAGWADGEYSVSLTYSLIGS